MDTPIVDFLKVYNESDMLCFHMPGHKGVQFLGIEQSDITEIKGAKPKTIFEGRIDNYLEVGFLYRSITDIGSFIGSAIHLAVSGVAQIKALVFSDISLSCGRIGFLLTAFSGAVALP